MKTLLERLYIATPSPALPCPDTILQPLPPFYCIYLSLCNIFWVCITHYCLLDDNYCPKVGLALPNNKRINHNELTIHSHIQTLKMNVGICTVFFVVVTETEAEPAPINTARVTLGLQKLLHHEHVQCSSDRWSGRLCAWRCHP